MAIVEHTTASRSVVAAFVGADINRSVEFYQNKLGFALAGRAGSEGKLFGWRLERGGTSIMLQQVDEEDGQAAEQGRRVALYSTCDDADAMHAELLSRPFSRNWWRLRRRRKQLCAH